MTVAISRVGGACADTTSVTIPVGHVAGDMMLIFAFRAALTAPTLPAGWTDLGSGSAGASAYRVGWRLAASNAETSGTWTNAIGVACVVYRNVSRVAFLDAGTVTGTGTTLTFGDGSRYAQAQTSWCVSFAGTKAATTLATAPSGETNVSSLVGAANAYAVHDSNGINTDSGAFTARTTTAGVSAEWRTATVELKSDISLPADYQSVRVGTGMSTIDKVR